MERREALRMATLLLGGSLVGSELFLSGCSAPPKGNPHRIADRDLPLLDALGETILPATAESPGAKAAHIGLFIQGMVNDCYDLEEAALLLQGLAGLKERSRSQYGKEFPQLSPTDQLAFLTPLDREARENRLSGRPHFFGMLKELTVWGYFSSEVGATKALRYNPVPGRYEGCIPYHGENAWAQ